MSDLVKRLRRQLTMSMFATKDDLYGQLHEEREQAADRIEQLERVLLQSRDALETISAQHSGEVCSTKLSDCMASIASGTLMHFPAIDEALK